MATTQQNAAYECPKCADTVTFDRLTWQCEDCGYVPYHCAD